MEHECYRNNTATIFINKDLRWMGAYLGREVLFLLYRDKNRPAWIDASEPQRETKTTGKTISAVDLRTRLEKLSKPNNSPAVYSWN